MKPSTIVLALIGMTFGLSACNRPDTDRTTSIPRGIDPASTLQDPTAGRSAPAAPLERGPIPPNANAAAPGTDATTAFAKEPDLKDPAPPKETGASAEEQQLSSRALDAAVKEPDTASADAAKLHGLTPKVRIVAMATAGVAPRVMGIGPVPAVRKVLAKVGMNIGEMDVIELNEAFAAQALAVTRDHGLPDDAPHVNPNGGAIAIGHPLGASGARLVTTATYQLLRSGGRYALCTMCIGVGQGIAMIIERV